MGLECPAPPPSCSQSYSSCLDRATSSQTINVFSGNFGPENGGGVSICRQMINTSLVFCQFLMFFRVCEDTETGLLYLPESGVRRDLISFNSHVVLFSSSSSWQLNCKAELEKPVSGGFLLWRSGGT